MTRSPWLLLALVACLSAGAESVESHSGSSADPHEHMQTDVRGTKDSIQAVRAHVARLDSVSKDEARAAAALIAVNCPYNRAAIQLPIALSMVAERYPAKERDPLIEDDWRRLQQGLAMHVDAIDDLTGRKLPTPLNGDYLVQLPAEATVDRAGLDASDDPLALTLVLIEQVRELVAEYDDATIAKLDASRAVLEPATGGHWPMSRHLGAWQQALEKMEPLVQDPQMARDVHQMVDTLQAFSRVGC